MHLCTTNSGVGRMKRETVPIINFQKELKICKITQILREFDESFASELLKQLQRYLRGERRD